jgi:hypothetical protein
LRKLIFAFIIFVSCTERISEPTKPAHVPSLAKWNGNLWEDTLHFNYDSRWDSFNKDSILIKANEPLELSNQHFRFIMNRAFNNTMIFSLNFSDSTLLIKEINDVDLFHKVIDKSLVIINYEIKLNATLFRKAFLKFKETNFFNKTSLIKFYKQYTELGEIIRVPTTDGSNWYLEAKINNKYNFVFRPSPRDESFFDFCTFLIRLHKKNEEIY